MEQSIEEQTLLPEIYHVSSDIISQPIDPTELGGKYVLIQENKENKITRFSAAGFSKPISSYPIGPKGKQCISTTLVNYSGQNRQVSLKELVLLTPLNKDFQEEFHADVGLIEEENPYDTNAVHIFTRWTTISATEVRSLGYVPSVISRYLRGKLEWITSVKFKIYKGKNDYLVPVIGFYYEGPRRKTRFSNLDI